ncbi:transposase [Metallosphaera yellowstonensis MK1]|uniref:Transposase n=1 Tax=Metallosphaera yellowstonensis MK1 TaxID=671065 RepID=H2C4R3_9CREN|nr:transposase [Metallosphaera yellowstonensis MK1]
MGHGEVARDVQGKGEGEDWSGGVAQGGEAGAQVPPPARVGREVERRALDPGAGGEGDFKYVVVDGKYVKLRGGRRGVLLIALGLTDHGVRAVLDVVPTGEEDVVSYWDLPVRLWRRYNLTLVVADGVKALDTAISRSGIKVARQTCPVYLKRRVDRRVRVLLDLLLSFAESVPIRGSPLLSYLLAPREAPPQVEQPGRVLQLPPGEFGKCHSPWRTGSPGP